jgi:hypothetical protein
MSIDWDIYSDRIENHIDNAKDELLDGIHEVIKNYIGDKFYFFLKNLIPIIDTSQDQLTLRLSWDCFFNKNDKRNILFNLEEELSDYDGGNFVR